MDFKDNSRYRVLKTHSKLSKYTFIKENTLCLKIIIIKSIADIKMLMIKDIITMYMKKQKQIKTQFPPHQPHKQ